MRSSVVALKKHPKLFFVMLFGLAVSAPLLISILTGSIGIVSDVTGPLVISAIFALLFVMSFSFWHAVCVHSSYCAKHMDSFGVVDIFANIRVTWFRLLAVFALFLPATIFAWYLVFIVSHTLADIFAAGMLLALTILFAHVSVLVREHSVSEALVLSASEKLTLRNSQLFSLVSVSVLLIATIIVGWIVLSEPIVLQAITSFAVISWFGVLSPNFLVLAVLAGASYIHILTLFVCVLLVSFLYTLVLTD